MRLNFIFLIFFTTITVCNRVVAQTENFYFLEKKQDFEPIWQLNKTFNYQIVTERVGYDDTEKVESAQQKFSIAMSVTAIDKNNVTLHFILPRNVLLWRAIGEQTIEKNTDNQPFIIKILFDTDKRKFNIAASDDIFKALCSYAATLPDDERGVLKDLQVKLQKKDITTLENSLKDVFYWLEAYNFPIHADKNFKRNAFAWLEANKNYDFQVKKIGKNVFYSFHQPADPTKHRYSVAYDEQNLPLSVGLFYTAAAAPKKIIHTWTLLAEQ
jgi:hypothetical protein